MEEQPTTPERDPNGVTTWAMVNGALEGDPEQETLADEVGGWFEEDPLPEAEALTTRITERMNQLSDWTAGRIYWALMRSEGPINAKFEQEHLKQTFETGLERLATAQTELDPETPAYWSCMRMRAQLLQTTNPNQAIALFEQIRTSEVADTDDVSNAANSLAHHMAQTDLPGAIQLLESTLERIADSPENRRATLMLNLANFKSYSRDTTGATMLLSQVMGMQSLDAPQYGMVRIHFAAIVLIPNKKHTEAIRILTEAIDHPSVPEQIKEEAKRIMPLDPSTYRLYRFTDGRMVTYPSGGGKGSVYENPPEGFPPDAE